VEIYLLNLNIQNTRGKRIDRQLDGLSQGSTFLLVTVSTGFRCHVYHMLYSYVSIQYVYINMCACASVRAPMLIYAGSVTKCLFAWISASIN